MQSNGNALIFFSCMNVHILDSHTEGEPTRLVIGGIPDLGEGPIADRCARFAHEYDRFRSFVVQEPRGADHVVGALLLEPFEPDCAAGVVFFNNAGVLGMCGHGTIGLVVSLAHLGQIGIGTHRIDTPVGVVSAQLHDAHRVSIRNVPSFRFAKDVEVEVEGIGSIRGDIAWGGNWFFLVAFDSHKQELHLSRARELTDFARRIKNALADSGVTGANAAEIDHVELFSKPLDSSNDARNFVLCPGVQYDRSPCGTGTSAKLACLYADGKLKPGQTWRQEGILGTVFEGQIELNSRGEVVPTITGSAWVTAEAQLLRDETDPLRDGVRA